MADGKSQNAFVRAISQVRFQLRPVSFSGLPGVAMTPGSAAPAISSLSRRLRLFTAERYPFAARLVAEAFDVVTAPDLLTASAIDPLRAPFGAELRRRLERERDPVEGETTPG